MIGLKLIAAYEAGVEDERHAASELIAAVLAYDAELEACANDPEKMASHCTAQGQTLDDLYARMVGVARTMKAKTDGDG